MRQAAEARSTSTKESRRIQAEHDAAYRLGYWVVKHWPAARKKLPAGAVLADWRNECARDFLAHFDPSGHFLLPSYLVGWDEGAEDRYPRADVMARPQGRFAAGDTVLCIDVEDADEWLTTGRTYRVRAVIADVLVITDDTGDEAARHHASHFVPV